MIELLLRNIWRGVFLILFQALILNYMDLSSLVYPMVYVGLLLMLPIDTPRWLYLLIGFSLGMIMDLFTRTPGLHASACTFLALIIPTLQSLLAPRDGYEGGMQPMAQNMGVQWYAIYGTSALLLHHIWFFSFEYFRLSAVGIILLKSLLSAILGVLLLILMQYLLFKPVRSA